VHAAASHLLVFQVENIARLNAVLGSTMVAACVADTRAALDAQASSLLGRHGATALPASTTPGRWWQGFTMHAGALTDATEQAKALAAAVRVVGHKTLLKIFGNATGAKLSFSAGVVAMPAPLPADIDFWLGQTWRVPASQRADLVAGERAALTAVIAGDGLRTLLQPIVALPSGTTLGYEALTRGPLGSSLEAASDLFGAGERFNLSRALELACARQAVATVPKIPQGHWLSVNLGLEALSTPGVIEFLARPGVVLELTEHLPLDQAEQHTAVFQKIRSQGGRLALDDTGCGFADMAAVADIRPDIVKLCISVVRNANRSSEHLAEIARTIAECQALGARVLAEGVETREQAEALTQAGAQLAQGWHFGHPVPATQITG
jgi:EAL domain-containing protein (putative c-di-GMP-specific phosphodiesterase class I)